MEEERIRFREIFYKLNTGDLIKRNSVCDEALRYIEEVTNSDLKEGMCEVIVFLLIHLGRSEEAKHIIDIMVSSINISTIKSSFFARIEYSKNINDGYLNLEKVVSEAIEFAKKNELKEAECSFVIENAKILIKGQRYDEAITKLSGIANIAETTNNNVFLATSKYYMGLCLYFLGKTGLANEFFLQASEIASIEHNFDIAILSEMMRANIYAQDNNAEISKNILQHCMRNFSMTLC